jgi:hypothetical protein
VPPAVGCSTGHPIKYPGSLFQAIVLRNSESGLRFRLVSEAAASPWRGFIRALFAGGSLMRPGRQDTFDLERGSFPPPLQRGSRCDQGTRGKPRVRHGGGNPPRSTKFANNHELSARSAARSPQVLVFSSRTFRPRQRRKKLSCLLPQRALRHVAGFRAWIRVAHTLTPCYVLLDCEFFFYFVFIA